MPSDPCRAALCGPAIRGKLPRLSSTAIAMAKTPHAPADVASVLAQVARPKRALVTAGMPYANGPVHLGHLAGAQLPADIYARWMGLLIRRENVLFVNGTDAHGSTSGVAAVKAGVPIRALMGGRPRERPPTMSAPAGTLAAD